MSRTRAQYTRQVVIESWLVVIVSSLMLVTMVGDLPGRPAAWFETVAIAALLVQTAWLHWGSFRRAVCASAEVIWLVVPQSHRDEVEGDFWATLDEATRRGVGPVGRKWLAALVVARYACVVLWFLVYRVLKVLVLLSKLGSAS